MDAAVGMTFAGLSVLTMILRQLLGVQRTRFDGFVTRTWVQLGCMIAFGCSSRNPTERGNSMSRRSLGIFACVSALVALSGMSWWTQTGTAAAATRAADEAVIRAATSTLEQGVQTKDLDKAVSAYEDNAVLFVPKAPASVGKEAIRQAWRGLLAAPGVKLALHVTAVDVARSGDIAVERGTFQVVTTDKEGKPNTETGQLVIVWKKVNGSWKIIADTNADDK